MNQIVWQKIKQLNGGVTDFYFITNNTFWSSNLNKLKNKGYSFEVFDIFYEEAIKNKDKKIKKRERLEILN